MNKQQLITHISGETGLPCRQVRSMIDHLLQAVTLTFKQGNGLSLKDFGSFRPACQKQRLGRNPKTGEPALIPSRIIVKFRGGRALLKSLNEHEDNE